MSKWCLFWYKGWHIDYNPKPIPDRRHDYDVTHRDYDGPESNLYFTAASIKEAIAEIDERELDE